MAELRVDNAAYERASVGERVRIDEKRRVDRYLRQRSVVTSTLCNDQPLPCSSK